jgi:predicted permease
VDADEGLAHTTLHGVQGVDAFRGLGSIVVPVLAFVGLLMLVGGLVLLVACANVAGLLLGRAAARRREIAIRLALGAGRARLMRQLLAESLLLAAAGAAAGLVMSIWLTALAGRATNRLAFPVEFDLTLDWRTLVFVAGVACATALLFGLAPARRAARTDLVPALKDVAGPAHQRFRRRLVTGQVFVCTVLLLWAWLFAASLTNASRLDPGFIVDGVLVVDLDVLGRSPATPALQHERLRAIHQRATELPGVTAAGLAWSVPLGFMAREEHGATPTGGDAMRQTVFANTISPGYLKTLGIPLRAGRDIAWNDHSGSLPVAIVNETAARVFWNGNAIGQRLRVPQQDATIELEIIGIAADSKYWTPGEAVSPTIYRPMLQRTMGGMHLFVRTRNAAATAAALELELARLSPPMPIEIVSLASAIEASMLPARVGAFATAGFGAAAILLAVIGIYGLVAFSVSQRMREMGIRRAIGASRGHIVRLVLAGSLGRVTAGVLPGLLLGGASAVAFSGFLVEVSPFDAPTLAIIAALMLGAGAAASLGPALRAARVDPLGVLRQD